MSQLHDQYLLFRIRVKNDQEAFGRLYDRYVQVIYRFVFAKLASRELAEDVTAETFLRCWQYIQKQKDIFHVRALLYRIARNLVADHFRRSAAVPPALSLQLAVTFDVDGTSNESEGELSDRGKSSRGMEAQAECRLLLDRVSRLKEDYQDVLLLRLVEGLGFREIAKVLEKTPGNVRVIYHRAIRALEPSDENS